jgi:phenylacetate-CoA ligase
MIWNREMETLPRERLAALQLTRLRDTVESQLRAVPVMRERLRASGLTSSADIRSLDDLRRLPFSRKSDLRDNYPFGLFAVPREQIVRIHASSGTRGKPTVVGYSRHDLAVWSEVMARCFALAGVETGMVVHNAYGYGLFTGGLGFHQGAELMGCTVIPISGGVSQRQVLMLQDLGGEVLCCTPSYALNLAQTIQEHDIAPGTLRLKIGIFGAEPWSEAMRDEIERQFPLKAINLYGLSEIVGPGVSAECAEVRRGAHVHEDHFLPEIVDPATGEPLPNGQEGELVLTTLTKEALPMLRYRTGDLTSLSHETCACGRTTVRMARVHNRVDDMLIIKGVNIYPSEIERILLDVEGLSPHYQILVDRPAALDELTILVEPSSPDVDVDRLRTRTAKAFHDGAGLHARIEVLARGAVPRSEGKAVRVIDRRPRQ